MSKWLERFLKDFLKPLRAHEVRPGVTRLYHNFGLVRLLRGGTWVSLLLMGFLFAGGDFEIKTELMAAGMRVLLICYLICGAGALLLRSYFEIDRPGDGFHRFYAIGSLRQGRKLSSFHDIIALGIQADAVNYGEGDRSSSFKPTTISDLSIQNFPAVITRKGKIVRIGPGSFSLRRANLERRVRDLAKHLEIPFHESPENVRLRMKYDKDAGRKVITYMTLTRRAEWRTFFSMMKFAGFIVLLVLFVEFMKRRGG